MLNARQAFDEAGSHTTILLGFEDITGRCALERENEELLCQKGVPLEELEHRVANSLQIIAAIISLKAKTVELEETRLHLHDAHKRVMSVAAVQQHLHETAAIGPVELLPYLTKLCEALAHSMIGDNRAISLKVSGDGGSANCRDAESLGLIVTELVINSLKHAFNENTNMGRSLFRMTLPEQTGNFRLVTMGLEAGRRLCPTQDRAGHRHRQGAGEATRCPDGNFERPQGPPSPSLTPRLRRVSERPKARQQLTNIREFNLLYLAVAVWPFLRRRKCWTRPN